MGAIKREKAWSDFKQWCKARGLRPLPANPWTIAAYASWCEARHGFPLIAKRIRVIARVHLLECAGAPDRHPTVTRTLHALEMRNRSRASRAALFPRDETASSGRKEGKVPRAAWRPRRTQGGLRASPRLVARRPKRP